MVKYLLLTLIPLALSTGLFAQFSGLKKAYEQATSSPTNNTSNNFTESEAGDAIKEALSKGILKGVDKVSVVDGYLKNDLIKIPFPENAKRVETTLRGIGLGSQVDKMIETINHAAENAAKES